MNYIMYVCIMYVCMLCMYVYVCLYVYNVYSWKQMKLQNIQLTQNDVLANGYVLVF